MDTTPLWFDFNSGPNLPALDRDLEVDVLVIGAGITGITAAYLINKTGLSVAVMERGRMASGQTGHTTAHITYVTDSRLSDLVKTFGRQNACAVWEAGAIARQQIEENVRGEGISCELRQVPGYLFAASDDSTELQKLQDESALAEKIGFDTSFLQSAPVVHRPAVRFGNQLKFHPRKYIATLADRILRGGGNIFEETEVTDFEESPKRARANGFTVHYKHVFFATHVPLQGNINAASAALLQTKLAAYSTYVVSAKIPHGKFQEGLFWDTSDPYLHLRIDRGEKNDYLIVGGKDHKTGQETNPELHYEQLEEVVRSVWPEATVDRRWSGQVIETADGLPYIGETGENQYVATGFAGNGMTFGTFAAIMVHDAILGMKNPWSGLFGVDRKKLSATWDYLKENKDYPYHLVKDRINIPRIKEPPQLASGEGRVVRIDGKKIAVHQNERGETVTMSAVCPHLGCIVQWNSAEKTWDCPCHGSRFQADGAVINGPAERPLTRCHCEEVAGKKEI